MGEFFTIYTLMAFVLGVILAGSVKSIVGQVKGKVSGA